MKTQRSIVCLLAAGAALVALNASANIPTGYQFDVTTTYSGSAPADLAAGASIGSPDTGYLQVRNAGSTTFNGQLSLSGVTPSSVSFVFSIPSITLAPGQHISLSLNTESSNQGGYGPNGAGNPQFGAQFTMNGTVTDGVDTESVLLQVFDRDIHSGVPRLANGTLSDSYVLQGGNPFGSDTGDAFEESQSPGHFTFLEQTAGGGKVPDAGSTAMLFAGALTTLTLLRRKAALL